jgi:signal transduction histidine kinase
MNTSNPISPPIQGEALHVLLVEDNSADGELILRELRRGGFAVTGEFAQTPDRFRSLVRADPPDVVLADYNLGQWRGLETVDILREEQMDVPVILVSGALGDVTAVECIKRGATDYVLKDSLARLPVSVRRALAERHAQQERKHAENQLEKKAEELARSNRDLEQFAYVASHDLQEPLRIVAAYTQLLGERYRGKLDADADKYIHYAVDGALRMQTLVRDLLAFSRAGRQGMETEQLDANELIRHAMLNLEASFRESGAKVHFDRLPMITANRSQLQQVFQNLIANAIKFHGAVPPQIEISAEENAGAWSFSVKDNGIGIAPEHMDSIFVIFHRLHTREEYPGNGIGLSICKKIIERHGGKIWVESEPGRGTTFRFTIPASTEREEDGSIVKEHSHEQETRSLVSG